MKIFVKKILLKIIYAFFEIFHKMKLLNTYSKLEKNSNINIGKNFFMAQDCRLETVDYYRGQNYSPLLEIGNNVHIENRVHIGCVYNIKISDDVLIGSNVLIIDHNHGYYDNTHKNLHENPLSVAPAL